MKGTEYSVSLQMSIVITDEYNVMVNSEELIGTTEYLTLWTRCRINRCRYKRVLLYIYIYIYIYTHTHTHTHTYTHKHGHLDENTYTYHATYNSHTSVYLSQLSWKLVRWERHLDHQTFSSFVRQISQKPETINLLKTKRRSLYLKTLFVPRSKHFSYRL